MLEQFSTTLSSPSYFLNCRIVGFFNWCWLCASQPMVDIAFQIKAFLPIYTGIYLPCLGHGRCTIYWGIKTLMTLKSVNSYCWYITIDSLFGHVRAHYGIFDWNYLSIPKLQRFNARAHCGMFGYMPLIAHGSSNQAESVQRQTILPTATIFGHRGLVCILVDGYM